MMSIKCIEYWMFEISEQRFDSCCNSEVGVASKCLKEDPGLLIEKLLVRTQELSE